MKSVRIAPEAAGDADEISDYIARDDPERADSFVDELLARARQIGEGPRRFRLRPEIGPGLRAARHGPYLVIFDEQPDYIRVLRILHGARDLKRVVRRGR